MKERKKAGHLSGARIVEAHDCCIVVGYLLEDQRGTHYTGESRNFSRSNIHTSWLERVEYVEHADTTVIYTRNSIYFAPGNIIEPALGEGKFYAEGKEEIKDLFTKHLAKQKPEVEENVVYELTPLGDAMTGEGVGTYIVPNLNWVKHNLCGPAELPFCLMEDAGTGDIDKVFFLKELEFKRASLPLKESHNA
ncbi:hypothetical protein VPHD148_0155 [Vibrio phage D148]